MEKEKKGVIKWYSSEKDYGFITNENNEDVFFKKENISSSKDTIDKEKTKEDIFPEIGDKVSYIEFEVKGQKRSKKIIINERKNSVYICPYCKEEAKPKIIFEQNEKIYKVGDEFEEKKPMYTICSNCLKVLNEYNTKYDKFSNYNRAAVLLLILVIIFIFVKFNS